MQRKNKKKRRGAVFESLQNFRLNYLNGICIFLHEQRHPVEVIDCAGNINVYINGLPELQMDI